MPPPADVTARKWAAAVPATPSMFAPAATAVETTESPARPTPPKRPAKAKPRRSLKGEVETKLRELGIPYVAVDEAKKAMFANAKLKSFHYVVYCKAGDNWLLWCGEPSPEVRLDMDQWQKVFGEGFRVVYALRRVGGIVYRTPTGEALDLAQLLASA